MEVKLSKVNMVRKEGGSRVVSLSSVLPPDWLVVEITKVEETKIAVIIKLVKVK